MIVSSFRRFRRQEFLRSCLMLLLLITASFVRLSGQMLSGTSVADTAGPTVISPSGIGKDYFVLNKDLSITGRFNAQTTSQITCAPPAGFSAASSTQRTLINDGTAAYFTAQSASANAAASTASPGYPCSSAAPLQFAGGTPTQTFTSNDPRHGRFYALESFSGNGADTLTVVNNLNSNNSSTPSLTKQSAVTVDTGAVYTAMLTDTTSDYGNTIITERRTDTSPGGLLVYSPGIQTVFRILGPGGVPLPAIGAFFMPSPANDNGQLLVLINQDGLTSSNLASPPAVTSPFTIIDLGQLQRAFSAVVSQGKTITLPKVTTVPATQSYFATLGAVYSPVFHLAYALVASGTSSSAVTQSILRYDLTNPSAPAETVVADVSNVPLTFGTYPQLALNAAGGTLDILSQGGLYHVVVAGRNNTATQLTGSTFGDTNFVPTYVASNPLLGETYIASSASVDILGITGSTTKRAVIELYGQDNAVANQSYTLQVGAVNPDYDRDLTFANVTFTATPDGGAPITLGTGQFYQFTGASIASTSVTFPAAGIYTVVATVPATTNYPAITSLPIRVGVGATRGAPVYPTVTRLVVPATSNSTTVTAQLTLTGSTYAPSGRIVVSDSNGNEVGRYTFTGGATSYPVTATLTLPSGSSTLTATYNGDTQNQTSTSAAANISVGSAAMVTPTLSLSVPATGTAGATLSGSVVFGSSTTTAPTDTISVYAVPAGTTTPITLATIPAAQAFTATGRSFNFTAPSSGTYTVLAYYPGDANYNTVNSATSQFVSSAVAKGTINLSLSIPATATAGTPNSVGNVATTISGSNTATPTGTVTILAQNTNGTSVTLATFPAANAKTTLLSLFTFTAPPSGTYAVTANYPGDANFNPSTSNVITLTSYEAGPTTTTVNLSAPSLVTEGTPFNLTVAVKPKALLLIPISGNVVVSAFPVLNSGKPVVIATVPATQAIANGGVQVQATLPIYGASQYDLTATYVGDANYGTSTATVGISAYTTTRIVLTAPATGFAGTPVSINVLLEANSPTGNITVTSTLNGAAGPSTSIVASIRLATLTFPSAGTYTINASYAGDLKNSASVAASPATIVIAAALTGPQFAMTLDEPKYADSISPALVQTDQTKDVSITLTAQNGFNSPVTLSETTSGSFTGTVTFVDSSGNTITSVTPTAAGTHVNVHFKSTVHNTSSRRTPFEHGQSIVLCGLVGVSLLGLRRQVLRNRALRLLGLAVVVACGTLLPGCAAPTDQIIRVTLTGTPATTTQGAAAQQLSFYIDSVQ